MSAKKFFSRRQTVGEPVKREVLLTDTETRKVYLQKRNGDILQMGFANKTNMLFILYEILNENNQKHAPAYRISIYINNTLQSYSINLQIPVLDLAVKKTQQYVEETKAGVTKYVKNDSIEIFIQDVPIDEYVKMQGFATKLLTMQFLKGYQKIKSTDVEISSAEMDKIMSKSKPVSFQLTR